MLSVRAIIFFISFIEINTSSEHFKLEMETVLIKYGIIFTSFGANHDERQIEIIPINNDKIIERNVLHFKLYNLLLQNQETKIIFHILCPSSKDRFVNLLKTLSYLFQSFQENFKIWKPQVTIHLSNDSIWNDEEIQNLLREETHLKFPIDSEILIVLQLNNTVLVSVWEIYEYKNVSRFQKINNSIGDYYNYFEPFELIQPISIRRQNLSGIKISAVAQNDPDYQPRIKIKTNPDGTVQFVSGMCLRVLENMQFMLNFSYTPLDGKGWVGLYPNGTWTGMSGQVVNGEADISIAQASTIMMTDQLHGISFLHPTSSGRLVAIFRQPPASSIRDIMLSAFEYHVWICYGFAWVVLLISIRIFYRAISTFEIVDETDKQFFSDFTWWAISVTCFISWHLTPNSFSIRFLFMIGVIMSLLMYVGFSASLITNLFNERVPIKNYEDLSKSSLTIAADKWLPMAHKVAQDVYIARKLSRNLMSDNFLQLESAIPQILTKSLAFVTFADGITVVFHRLKYSDVYYCHTVDNVAASQAFFSNAMYVKRGSPLKELLNPKILMMIERGLLSRQNRRYDTETLVMCSRQKNQYRGGLSIMDVITPYIVLTFGFTISFVVCLIERKFKNSFHIGVFRNCNFPT